MEDFKRITARNALIGEPISVLCKHCNFQDKCDFTRETCCDELAVILAELEDKIESGELGNVKQAVKEFAEKAKYIFIEDGGADEFAEGWNAACQYHKNTIDELFANIYGAEVEE